MSRVEWNKPGERSFEAGIDQCVLYPKLGQGVPWNGLVSVSESTAGGELESLYFDGVKYLDIIAGEDFQATIEAFSAPIEFAAADGVKMISPGLFASQQPRETFGICYRTLKGNDLKGTALGYKLHIVYNCTASPAGRTNQTLSDTVAPGTLSWSVNTVPPVTNLFRPTAHLVVDSTLVDPYLMEDLETALYGRDASEAHSELPAYLPTVSEIIAILANPITEFIEDFI